MDAPILVVDHRDSFTYNLVHLLEEFSPVVVQSYPVEYTDIQNKYFKMLVLSPGPGNPSDYKYSLDLYQKTKGFIPVLGVCLGFQMIVEVEGGEVIRQKKILHGVQTTLHNVENSVLFAGIEDKRVGRYHSLQANCNENIASLNFTARDADSGVPLAFENHEDHVYGMQFHPESFLTPSGHEIIRNLLRFIKK